MRLHARRRSDGSRRQTPRFIVVTGMSGAGKSQAIRALEDLGFFCVDNLPIPLIPTFADLTITGATEGLRRAAVVVDVREGAALAQFPQVYRRLKRRPELRAQLLFLDSDDATILRRFSETRRPHPLAPDRSPAEGLRDERRRLAPIRKLADRIVETGHLSVHDLRRRVQEFAGGGSETTPLAINVLSFGFKHGPPADADLMFDVRFLPNPHFVSTLRPLTGKQPEVARYVMRAASAKRFLQLTTALLQFLVPQYIAEGKTYLTLAIGCTGGRHRSVAIAEALSARLGRLKGARLRVRHRDIEGV